MNEIPIFFSIDDAYAPYLSVALDSAIRNSNPKNRYRAIVLHEKLSEENLQRLKAQQTAHFAIDFVAMETGLESITDNISNRLRCDYFTLTIYFRLLIPKMFPQYDKGIYIDSDVIVPGDLADLYRVDIGDNYIGACVDKSVGDVPPLVEYMEQAVGVPGNQYINSGVLLMDLKTLREKKLDEHFLHLLNTYHFDCIAPDQDYINAICFGKIHYLDERWDAMPNDNHPPLENPGIIHYNLFAKPWCYDHIQYGDLFWEYAKNTPYFEQIRAFKENYSKEQKESDEECGRLLCTRGLSITEQEVTFKRMFESGVKIRL